MAGGKARVVEPERPILERGHLESVIERLPAPTAVVVGDDFVFVAANGAYRRLVGDRDLLGRPIAEAIPEVLALSLPDLLKRVRDSGQGETGTAIQARWDRYGRGELTDGVVIFAYEPLAAGDGLPAGVVIQVTDVTEQWRANDEIERARRRMAFLADASVRLSASLDVERTLGTIADLAVPDLGDWCIIELLEADGSIRPAAVAHRDPEKVAMGKEVMRRYPINPDAPFGTGHVIRTRQSELAADITDEMLRAVAQDEEHLALLLGAGFRSSISVPLPSPDGIPIGVLSLAVSESERRYGQADVALAEELARRAASALTRARAYAAEREARDAAERAADRTRRLQRLTSRLNEAVSREQIADVILETGLATVGADAASLALIHVGPEGEPLEFEIIRTAGFSDEVAKRYRRFPFNAARPVSAALERRATVLIASPAIWRRDFPQASEDLSSMGFRAFVAVPAVVGDRVLAVVSFSFREEQSFDEETRGFIATLGEQCALALERARLQDDALQLAEKHAALVDTIQDAFSAFDGELRFTYVNQRAAQLAGRRMNELLGRRIQDVFPEAVGSPVYEALREVLDSGEAREIEAFSKVTRSWIHARIYPAAGGVSLFYQDITARKHAQDTAAFMAEASRLLSATLDYEETLRAVAEAAVPRLGDWCAIDLVQQPGAGIWPPQLERVAIVHQDPEKVALGRELERRWPREWGQDDAVGVVLRTGAPLFIPNITDEMIVAGARDEEHLAVLRALSFSSIMVVPLSAAGLTLGTLTLCMTESGRHYLESDLAVAEDLASRAAIALDNARLLREAERARAEAEAASRAKSDFLAVMSHELRTPLNAIAGHVQLLEMGLHGEVTQAQHDALSRIARAQRHLLGLITDVLNYARVESGRIEFHLQRVLVGDVLGDIRPLIDQQLTSKNIDLVLRLPESRGRTPLPVLADRDKLGQILLNLLSNAAKFTRPGGTVTVDLSHVPGDMPGADHVELLVSDTGIGIPSDKLEAIFEPFVQVASGYARESGGTGLGLAISRDLARGMGGDIVAESDLGVGTTLIVRLKRAD